MDNILIAILVTVVSFVASALMFSPVLWFAQKFDIVDNPNARKLQRVPIPVMGGMVVYIGILIGGLVLSIFMRSPVMGWGLLAMTIMMIMGTWDDVEDISASLRFLIEIGLVLGFMHLTGYYIDDLHGLWGVHELSPWVGIPLSLTLGVGSINAVNMIDGVDGYSSGYGMMACTCFAVMFWIAGEPMMACMAMIVSAALLPFFMHNVFGRRSKMFIGDGGTMMLGMIMNVFSFYALSGHGKCEWMAEEWNLTLTGIVLAIGSIPVFDTMRVMSSRMLHGHSPFKPDKTHLHHLYIDMGFSHLGAAFSILLLNFLVVVITLITWKLGASIDVQTYLVFAMGIGLTFVLYPFMRKQQLGGELDEEGYPKGTLLWKIICKIGSMSHMERGKVWKALRRFMDGPMLLRWR